MADDPLKARNDTVAATPSSSESSEKSAQEATWEKVSKSDTAANENALNNTSSRSDVNNTSSSSPAAQSSSENWMFHRASQRPNIAYLRSRWSSHEMNQAGTFLTVDKAPQQIQLPNLSIDQNDYSLRHEMYHVSLISASLCLGATILDFWHSKASIHHHSLLSTVLALFWMASVVLLLLRPRRSEQSTWALQQHCALATTAIFATTRSLYSLDVFLTASAFSLLVMSRRLNCAHTKRIEMIFDDYRKDREKAQASVDAAIETYAHQRLSFLSTVSQEVQDAALMVITTLEQFTPSTILANTYELLSACSIAVPIASISAIHTTIKQVCYISSHMQLISRLLREGHVMTPEKVIQSQVRHEFDIGNLVQNVGDALAGMAAKLHVNLVIFHSDNGMHYTNVVGDEAAIRHGLLNLLRNVLEGCTPGACMELGLNITPSENAGKLIVTLEVIHMASPALPEGLCPAMLPNANLTSELLRYVGGTLGVSNAGKNRTRYEVTLEMDAGSDNNRRLLLLEEPSLILHKQTGSVKFSNEPTLEELTKFIENLRGRKMVLHALEHSVFAKHLTSCLASWNADISHVPVARLATPMTEGASGDDTAAASSDTSVSSLGNRSTAREPSAGSTPDLPGSVSSPRPPSGPQVPSPAIEEEHLHSIPPTFILIDDDVETLENKLREFRSQPPTSANVPQYHQQHIRRHKHSKSNANPSPNFFHQGTTAIIHFTSLANYKRVRNTIQLFASAPPMVPFSMPRLVVVPKPAGPRRFLTALHTAWNNAVVEPHFMPIATSPSSPMPQSLSSSAIQRESTTPPTPGSAYIGTLIHEADRTLHRASPGEKTPERRRPNSSVYSPPSLNPPGTEGLDGGNYFPMIGSALGASSHVAPGTKFDPDTNLHHIAVTSGRRRSQADQQQASEPQQQQAPSPIPTQTADPQSNKPASPGTVPSGTTRRRRNTAHERPLEAMPFMESSAEEVVTGATTVSTTEGPISPTRNAAAEGISSPLVKSTSAPSGQNETQSARTEKTPVAKKMSFKLNKKRKSEKGSAFANVVSPPINVLIVEDNMINQAILSTWMKKHKIKCSVASNGQEAVERWKGGGFHLVLMDIQLPVMDGIEATKAIRAIEKEQKIGVLPTNTPSPTAPASAAAATALGAVLEDKEYSTVAAAAAATQEEPPPSTFRSPVIIVALTASSLESDRHAALAAGCNDFLTKPVSLEWLEKKIIEWGCMQALIDFEGWRRWKRTTSDQPKPPPLLPKITPQKKEEKETTAAEEEQRVETVKNTTARKGIVLLGAAGLVSKRRFSTLDEKQGPVRRATQPYPAAVMKSGSDSDFGSLTRSQSERRPPRPRQG